MSWRITPSFTPADEYFQNVSLLLHGNGTNGSTTITDNSPSPKTVTAVGNAQISTAQSKFGGASIAFDGSVDGCTASLSNDFNLGSADFTIEGWYYFNNGAENAIRIMHINYDVFTTGSIFFGKHGAASGCVTIYIHGYSAISSFMNDPTLPPSNQWVHYAFTRSGNTFRLFRDGVQVATNTFSGVVTTNTLFKVGNNTEAGGSYGFNGYIDDFRFTKGVARYTANFTPPAAQFPDI